MYIYILKKPFLLIIYYISEETKKVYLSLYTFFNTNTEGTFKGAIAMLELTTKEKYLINDSEYFDRYCTDEAERYLLEKEVNRQWLFDIKQPLEDDYTEDSMP